MVCLKDEKKSVLSLKKKYEVVCHIRGIGMWQMEISALSSTTKQEILCVITHSGNAKRKGI